MHIIIVVDERQVVAFLSAVGPSESDVGIGEEKRYVRHSVFVAQIRHRLCSDGDWHIVANVHISDVAADREPSRERITHRHITAYRLDSAVVDISRRRFSTADVNDITLDVISRIVINQAAF